MINWIAYFVCVICVMIGNNSEDPSTTKIMYFLAIVILAAFTFLPNLREVLN